MLTRYGAANGKFNVFNQKKIIPAADFFEIFAAHHEARSRNRAAGTEKITRFVKVAALAHIPESASRRNPAVIVVFRITKTRCNIITRIEHFVHLRCVMLIHKIIGIEDEKGIKGIRIILFNVLKYEIKCVSFADFCQIVSFVNDCSRMSCNFGGFVRAVIRRNKNANSARVILRKQSPDAVLKRFFFVARTNNGSKTVLLPIQIRIGNRCFTRIPAVFRNNAIFFKIRD